MLLGLGLAGLWTGAIAQGGDDAAELPPESQNPYAATVAVDDESDKSRDKGLRLALIDVLKRVVGRSEVATAPILARASGLVQTYGFERDPATGTLSFMATFDPTGVNEALKAAGLPIFGVDTAVIEAWTPLVRGMRSASDYAEVLRHFERIRGVRKVDIESLSEDGMRLRMVVEGGVERAEQLATVGGRIVADGARGYVLDR